MKKLSIILTSMCMALLVLVLTPKSHAYTLTGTANVNGWYYNQTTETIGQADLLDIGSTFIEYWYFNLGYNEVPTYSLIRIVFTNTIPSNELPLLHNSYQNTRVIISFYNTSNTLLYTDTTVHPQNHSFSYFETNFTLTTASLVNIDYITIRIENLTSGYDEDNAHLIMHGAQIGRGGTMVINQTVGTTQYSSGWSDAMGSKIEQIWSTWDNIFATFMSVFNIFNVQLIGDITIGHIALVPLVLGLIGFIYALGGKRGR